MPRGVPKSALSASMSSTSSVTSLEAPPPPPTRVVSARSAKTKANASILEHDTDIDALIRKHDKKGARGFAKVRAGKATTRPSTATDAQTDEESAAAKTAPKPKGKLTNKLQQHADMDNQVSDHGNEEVAPKKAKKSAKASASSTKKSAASEHQAVSSGPISRAKTRSSPRSKATRKVVKDTAIAKRNADDDEKETILSTPRKAVLSESKQSVNRTLQPSSSDVDQAKVVVSSSLSSSSPTKPRHLNLDISPSRLNPATPAKKQKAMPEYQISSFLENYDLEAENRIRMAHKTLQISVESARTQMHAKAIAKLPRTVRLMRMADFLSEYDADVQSVVERAAVVANRAREGAWEEEKLQRKRKGNEEEEEDNSKVIAVNGKDRSKSARLEAVEATAAGSSKAVLSTTANVVSVAAAQAKRGKGKKVAHSAATGKRLDPRSAVRQSPVRPLQNSTVRPPSSATFSPHLAGGTVIAGRSSTIPALPPTPAGGQGRAARAGERVQWMSMNGSPIIGIVGPDGAIHSMPRVIRRSPTATRQKQSNNWQAIGANEDQDEEDDDQDAAETSAHLLELAKGIDAFRRSRDSHGLISRGGQAKTNAMSVDASPASQMSLHTAQASRRATLEGFESDDGESVFEEARSRPYDDDDDEARATEDESLPDEAAYMAQIMREEAQKRSRMLASEPRVARSSASSRAYGARSSGSSSIGSMAHTASGRARASQSTIRAASRNVNSEAASSSSSAPRQSSSSSSRLGVPSSPMVRSSGNAKKGNTSMKGSSSLRTAAAAAVSTSSPAQFPSSLSSSPNKGRVSIVFGTGASQRITHLGVEDLMRLPNHERAQMIDILEKLKRTQLSSDA